jgi:uncharacterized protein YbjQ (UPF0145 family)
MLYYYQYQISGDGKQGCIGPKIPSSSQPVNREEKMYTVKRGDQQYNAQDLNVLQQWANAGSILPTDMIFDPQSNQWVQAAQFPQIKDIIAQKTGAVQGQQQAQQAQQQQAQQQQAQQQQAQQQQAQQAQQQAYQAQQQAYQAQQQALANFVIVNTENVPGREIESVVGMVQGSTVRAKNIGKDFLAGFKNIVGGEVSEYTEMLNEARKLATDRMVHHAVSIGANAVVNARYTTSSVAQGMAEILAYGTAVKLKAKEQ